MLLLALGAVIPALILPIPSPFRGMSAKVVSNRRCGIIVFGRRLVICIRKKFANVIVLTLKMNVSKEKSIKVQN